MFLDFCGSSRSGRVCIFNLFGGENTVGGGAGWGGLLLFAWARSFRGKARVPSLCLPVRGGSGVQWADAAKAPLGTMGNGWWDTENRNVGRASCVAQTSCCGADGCSHVGFVVLVPPHGFSTPFSSFERNHAPASREKKKSAASRRLKTWSWFHTSASVSSKKKKSETKSVFGKRRRARRSVRCECGARGGARGREGRG